MSSSFETQVQECTMVNNAYHVEKPCAGSNGSVSLSTDAVTKFDFGLADIKGFQMLEGGQLLITFNGGETLTIENYDSAMAESEYQNIILNDGEVINLEKLAMGISSPSDTQVADAATITDLANMEPAAGEEFLNIIAKPSTAESAQVEFTVVPGETYVANFNRADVQSAEMNDNGDLIITFKDETQTIIKNYAEVQNATDIPQMSLMDGTVIGIDDLLVVALSENIAEVEEVAIVDVVDPAEIAQIEPASGDIASRLAQIEPAAGPAVGALGNTGANFGSSVQGIGLGPNAAEGPIGVTSLAFGRPEVRDDEFVLQQQGFDDVPPTVTFGDGTPADANGSAQVLEDGSVFVPITASLQGDTPQALTVTVSNIPNNWTITNTDGTYNATTGTWTITLPEGQDYAGGLTFMPPANSDVDISDLDISATATNTVTGDALTTNTDGAIIVDAVADKIDAEANNVSGFEDNPVALDIQAQLLDVDGSEAFTQFVICNIPNGFTLNAGTKDASGNWTVSRSDLANLELTPPNNYSGTLNLEIKITNEEVNLSDKEFNLPNNVNVTTLPFSVNFEAVADAPSLVVDNVVVKEDSSIFMPIEATLQDKDGSETLVVTVTNIDTTWTVATGANNGTYDATTGTWTITLPAGQDYIGGLTFTPPADSDLDMDDIRVTATTTESSNSTSSTVSGLVDIITDAVADTPTVNAGMDNSVRAGQSVDLNITNAVTDLDGSESLGAVTISGIPDGYTLSAGTKNTDGTWSVEQGDLAGLQLNTPVDGAGQLNLTVSVTATEEETKSGTNLDPDNDGNRELDLTDNTATNSDDIVITVSPDVNPPIVTFGDGTPADANGSAQVLEDNSILVPITATLQGNTPQQLTVTLTGVPSDWTVSTGANNGTFNASTGTWTITLPEGQNYTGPGLTFTPPADSDVDLSGLVITASARNTVNNTILVSDADGVIIVDAVADTPTIDAGANATVTAGQSIALNISNAVTDVDGSEGLGDVSIAGVPAGYSLSAGAKNSQDVWVVSQNDLQNLRLITPNNASGDVTLTVTTVAVEGPTDVEFNLGNNTARNSDSVTFTVNPPLTPPTVQFGDGTPADANGSAQVLEDNSVLVPITASLTGNPDNQVLTVEVAGVPSSWTITTGANNGTYNATTGTWTITLPEGQNYTGPGLTFRPPADSDIDLTGLSITATSTNTSTNETENTTVDGTVIVDAVADMPVLNVNNANGQEGQQISLNISSSLTDKDGSELLSDITISGVPSGFSLSAGTNNNGTWTVTQAQLNGLKLITPQSFSGSVPLSVSVNSTEQVSDKDFNLNNNVATNTKQLNVVISDTANPPTLDVDGTHQVLEDGSVFVPFGATLNGNGQETLTVSVSEIPSSWTITTGANNGTYNASTGTWTITLPAGQNYDGGLTFAPPADSDIDLNNIRVKANAFSPETNTNSSITELVDILVDAVADAPVINAGADGSVVAGQSFALNISDSLTDTDGSESLGNVTISGVPNGYTLSAGVNNGGGSWTVTQDQLSGLKLNTPANGSGNVTLKASVTSTEKVSDGGEFILTNNTATSTDTVVIAVNPDNQPPVVKFGDGSVGDGSAQVLEDGSVLVPITASLQGNAPQQLSVEVSGIPSSWTITTGANNGTYNASTGTWTITLPAGQNYTGPGLTFRPPANSDVDLTGLSIKATSTNTSSGVAQSSTVAGSVIVDAVADVPNLSVQNASIQEGVSQVKLNISTAVTDTDGSESISKVVISGVPSGFTLSTGSNLGNGSWELTLAQSQNVSLNVPTNRDVDGVYNLTVQSFVYDKPTDVDYITTNNTASKTATLTVTVIDDVPVVTTPDVKTSFESQLGNVNVINGNITADFGSDGAGSFCIPAGSVFSATGAVKGGSLTSNGEAVVINYINGTTYAGVAGGKEVFKLVLNSNGSYTFTQTRGLDHVSATNANEVINLNFQFAAKDSDGDVTVSTLTVRVQDTGPIANDDIVKLSSCDYVTLGNVINNHNQQNNGTDNLSAEGGNKINVISFGGKTYEFADDGGQAMVVRGQHGDLYIFQDGSYAYVSYESSPKNDHDEVFGYGLVDSDGDVDYANLTINVVETKVTTNEASDYGLVKYGNNTIIDGQAAYKTADKDGAQVFGRFNSEDDVISGNDGNDALYGWKGNDTLYGGKGNDLLMGEQDNNTLYGGEGADIFAFHPDKKNNDNKFDTVMDFDLKEGDVLSLIDVLDPYVFGANSNISEFVKIVNSGNDVMLQVNSNGKGNDFKNVALIKSHSDLDAKTLTVDDLFAKGHIDVY